MFIKINGSIYNLKKFCEIYIYNDTEIKLLVDYKNNYSLEDFESKKECKAKFNEIERMLIK